MVTFPDNCNRFVMLQDFCLVTEIINGLIKGHSSNSEKLILYSTQGRIYLQLGDIQGAEKCFALAKAYRKLM